MKAKPNVKAMFPWPADFKTAANGSFLGKSQKHWQEQARRLYAECLVRASMIDNRSPVGAMVTKRILSLLEREDPEMLQEMIEERERCRTNLAAFVASFASDPPKKRRKRT